MILYYLLGLLVFAFYGISDLSTRGPMSRALDRYYGPAGKYALCITAMLMWPVTTIIITVGGAALVLLGAVIDPDNTTLATIIISILILCDLLALAGVIATGEKMTWGD